MLFKIKVSRLEKIFEQKMLLKKFLFYPSKTSPGPNVFWYGPVLAPFWGKLRRNFDDTLSLTEKGLVGALFGPNEGNVSMLDPLYTSCGQVGKVIFPHKRAPRGRHKVYLSHFGGIFYILYMGNVGGLGKEPIYSKSKLGNHCLNLILHIPGEVQYQFQAPFKMIFLEKNALDCRIRV